MLTRALSGVVFLAVVIGAIWYGALTFRILMAIVALGCLWEFQKLLFDHTDSYFALRRWFQIILAVAWLVAWFFRWHTHDGADALHVTLWIPVLGFWSYILLELFLGHPRPFQQIGLWLVGLIYTVFPILLYTWAHASTSADYNPMAALAPFVLIWTNDTMAYLTGRAVGRTPFFPRISPKKTWEGTIGGVICTIIIAWCFGAKLGGLTQNQWIAAAITVSVFGTLGDLVESMLKRSVGVKDSGNIMPGHGGFLDRFDSFIFAVPFVAWVITMMK